MNTQSPSSAGIRNAWSYIFTLP